MGQGKKGKKTPPSPPPLVVYTRHLYMRCHGVYQGVRHSLVKSLAVFRRASVMEGEALLWSLSAQLAVVQGGVEGTPTEILRCSCKSSSERGRRPVLCRTAASRDVHWH